jgi:hypothetical protein
MPRALPDDEVRRLRIRAQRLTPQPRASVLDVVRKSAGLQAQESVAGALSVRARSSGLIAADVDRARLEERSVVRTWAMRGTLHLLAAEDLGWLLGLLGPLFIARDRRRLAQLGVDDEAADRGVRIIEDFLGSHGPATRAAIRDELLAHGIAGEGQAAQHLIGRAALEGRVCCSADRGLGTFEFTRLTDWTEVGPPLPRDAALAELARRYTGAYTPATPEDFTAWSGLPQRDARAGWHAIGHDLIEMEFNGAPAWLDGSHAAWLDEPSPGADPLPGSRGRVREGAPVGTLARLLPRFDTYLLGYRGRDLALPAEHAKRIMPGGGILHASVLLDGRVIGRWQLKRTRQAIEVTIEPFEALPSDVTPLLEAEVEDIGRFLGRQASMTVAGA